MGIIQWLLDHKVEVLLALLALSEVLALVPAIKANSVFQLVWGWLKGIKEKLLPPAPPAA